jgi:hypothetical protein
VYIFVFSFIFKVNMVVDMGKKKTNFQKWLAYMKGHHPEEGLVPMSSENDSDKVLCVGDDGKPEWGLEHPWVMDPMAK